MAARHKETKRNGAAIGSNLWYLLDEDADSVQTWSDYLLVCQRLSSLFPAVGTGLY